MNFGKQQRALGEAMANTNGVGGLLEPCEHHWLVEVREGMWRCPGCVWLWHQDIGKSQAMSYNPRWGSDEVKSRYIRPYQTSPRIIWHCLSLPNSLMLGFLIEQNEMALMSFLIRYAHIPFYFRFSITSSALSIHLYAPPHWCNHMQPHSHSL